MRVTIYLFSVFLLWQINAVAADHNQSPSPLLKRITADHLTDDPGQFKTFKEKRVYFKNHRKKTSKKTRRTVGWALLGGSVLAGFITLLIVQENNEFNLGMLITWGILILVALTGIIFLLAGVNW